MKPQFELRSMPNYRMIVENARKYSVGPRIPTVIAVGIMQIFTVLFAGWMGFLDEFWYVIVIVAGIEFIIFFLPHAVTFFGLKALRKRNGGTLPEARITISDKITCCTETDEITYELADIVGVVHLKHSYKLQFTRRRSLLIDPNAFTKGTFGEFKQFLREKRPDLKIPD